MEVTTFSAGRGFAQRRKRSTREIAVRKKVSGLFIIEIINDRGSRVRVTKRTYTGGTSLRAPMSETNISVIRHAGTPPEEEDKKVHRRGTSPNMSSGSFTAVFVYGDLKGFYQRAHKAIVSRGDYGHGDVLLRSGEGGAPKRNAEGRFRRAHRFQGRKSLKGGGNKRLTL